MAGDAAPLAKLVQSDLSEIDKGIIALWFGTNDHHVPGMSARAIAESLQASGAPAINPTRLRQRLERDPRAIRAGPQQFKIAPRKLAEVALQAKEYIGPVRPDDPRSVLDTDLFAKSPAYIKNVVEQINITYSEACFDCSAVMIRRLFETLVIDAFEYNRSMDEITDKNGDIMSLSRLIGKLNSTTRFSVGRQTKQAGPHLKEVGDWSAHNRRHRAYRSDIEAAARHLRLACSDLLHLAGQGQG